MSSLRSCGLLAHGDNERAKQLLYALDDHVWGMKITSLEESADFATLTIEKLFSKLKSHKLSRKGRSNHDASFTSKALITSAHVRGHDAHQRCLICFRVCLVFFGCSFILSSLLVIATPLCEDRLFFVW
jgi:hypothetical protein